MKGLDLYFLPWIFSNLAGLLILFAAWKNPKIGRFVFALLFGWAAWKNLTVVYQTPDLYIEFAFLAIPLYHDLILGWFADHITPVVTIIAIGQALIAFGMFMKGYWVKIAAVGAIVFLIAVSPLGVGSAFPFPIVAAFAAYLILKGQGETSYLWSLKKSMEKTSKIEKEPHHT
ncbi:MAG: hypothetical protein HUJ22_06995 [Gracilimonas sp.]|uniref:hypothetical protein n=1 Tax=Gracilimonas sp. TaxID=1974203 RepID=UPI0019C419ED|nr:hypothetical protein [Gracilimonas sp.]MBD3616302.1 hypothetical protein [Gracilimonas sp.]